ncbi:MAG: adenylate/guanylate cyclase domain-containing protein [Planctomycetaceae bacterium]|nr:adenylate/guanylate cyclase domain-containing protein [Planctomycetaceae bacterium]
MATQTVEALVLIYDIRGFTAASRRIGTADLGAFATAAHREILDLFAQRPPTFVKNLGDGHLLIWDTPKGLDPALLDSVVAAARRAPETFRAFVDRQGPLGASLPRRVGIGIAHGETFKSDDYYGVTLNLAARLQNEARPEGLALSEGVFAAAAPRDPSLSRDFQSARTNLKGLGPTTFRVRRPFSWGRVLSPFLPWAAAAALVLGIVALADAGLDFPLAEPVRHFLDAHGLTVFRTARSEAEVRRAAAEWRARYLAFFDRVHDPRGWIRYSVGEHEERRVDVWSCSQAVTGILRDPGAPRARQERALSQLAAAFDPGVPFIVQGGVVYGWPAHENSDLTGAESSLWTIAAVSLALGRRELIPEPERAAWRERLRRAQKAAELHHPLPAGGWNMFPNQEALDKHSPYSSALALLALLELRAAGLPWGDDESVARRDALLSATAGWLISTFDPKAPIPGWRGTPFKEDRVSPGLTLQIYAELLRAESEAGIALPEALLAEIPDLLEDLVGKKLKEVYDAGENQVRYQSHRDREESARTGREVWSMGAESVNFLWHPWGIESSQRWLDRATRKGGADPAHVQRVRRSLGHLVVDLGADAFKEATSGFTFVASETLYGLSSIPLP